MPKFLKFICTSLCAYSCGYLHADAPGEPFSEGVAAFPILDAAQVEQPPLQELTSSLSQEVAPPVVQEAPSPAVAKKVVNKTPEVSVNPFTGKIKGRKVRMRLKPDLDSRIIKEVTKNELVVVVGEKGEFWAVQAPAATKAYVFRSFILDNVVEGNHVNVRLEPSLDAPIIAHLNSGDTLENPSISPINSKWLEVAPPPSTRFYIAKEYVEYAGGPEVKEKMDQKLHTAEQLLEGSAVLSKSELKKPFEEIDFDRVVKGYHTVINEFSEFTELVDVAKEALGTFQEEYLHKRLSHLETQNTLASSKESAQKTKNQEPVSMTDKMKLWQPIEEALYSSWAAINDRKSQRDYYEEQRLASVEITGIVEPYTQPVKAKPGDFILRENDLPVGYLYSTQVNLQDLVGKQVKLVAAPRPNNNFAFPAYYVLSTE